MNSSSISDGSFNADVNLDSSTISGGNFHIVILHSDSLISNGYFYKVIEDGFSDRSIINGGTFRNFNISSSFVEGGVFYYKNPSSFGNISMVSGITIIFDNQIYTINNNGNLVFEANGLNNITFQFKVKEIDILNTGMFLY